MPDKYERNSRGSASVQRISPQANSLVKLVSFRMKVSTSVVSLPTYPRDILLTYGQLLQGFLVALALLVTVVRCWVRLRLERRKLTMPDYLVWGAWLCSLGWFVCSATALHINIKRPLVDQNTDSVAYLVVGDFVVCEFGYGSHVGFLDSFHRILLL
jgi:hypothetical protein